MQRVDRQLNAVWKIVLSSYDGEKNVDVIKKSLVDEQRAWIRYKEDICDIFYSGYFGREGQVLHSFACDGKLIEDRINELRRFYCNGDKCGFDKEVEPYFVDINIREQVLDRLVHPLPKEITSDESEQPDDDAEMEKEYGINIEQDTLRDNKRFQDYKEKACLFTYLTGDKSDQKQRYEQCLSAIIEHRIHQININNPDVYDVDLGQYANMGMLFQKDDWIFGCDQSFICTAIGFPLSDTAYHKGEYIRIHWQYNSDEPVEIRFVASSVDKNYQSGKFVYRFPESKKHFGLTDIQHTTPVIINERISDMDSEEFLSLLLKEKELSFGVEAPKVESREYDKWQILNLSLAPFQEFFKNQKDNCEQLYGSNRPSLPYLKALNFTVKKAKLREDKSSPDCDREKILDYEIRTQNGDDFIALCDNTKNTYNTEFKLYVKEKNGQISRVQFENETVLDANQILTNPVNIGDQIMLHNFVDNGIVSDCGRDFSFVYDGANWRLSSYRYMPLCSLIPRGDWPVLYNTTIK